MKLKFLVIALFTVVMGFAQEKATLNGTLTDKDMNGEPLPFASITVKGTTMSTTADETGNYTLSVPAGEQTIVFTFLGYETKEVAVTFTAGETQTLNQELGSTSVQLNDVVIETVVNREKEAALLLDQKNAVEMKQVIGSQELSRKGVGDAAGAVAKTTGVAKAEGVNNVFVRGLGDRYNSTTLNGLPLPSEDPEYKNISLEFFGANIIKNVGINKTFSANLYGDVGGANIDITSKDADKKSILSASAGVGFNTNALSNTVLVADGAYNYFGFLKNGTGIPINDLTKYSFKTSLKPTEQSTPVNTNFNIVAGKQFELANDQSISVFGVILSESGYQYKEGNSKTINAIGQNSQDLKFQRSEYKATQAILGNAKYKFGTGRSISYNTLFLHDNNQSVADYNGFARNVNDNSDFANKSFIRRQQLNNNNLFVNQLIGEYKVNDKINLDAGVAYNMIRASEPDRRTNAYDYDYAGDNGGGYLVSANSSGSNNRYFSTLKENDITGKAAVAYTFNPESNLQNVLTIGINARHTTRDFDNTQFNFDFNRPVPVDINNPDGLFNQATLDLGKLNDGYDLTTGRGTAENPRAFDPFFYKGERSIYAGYAQIEYPFSEKFIAQIGVRFESFKQNVTWDTNLGNSNPPTKAADISKTYVLPSLNLKYSLDEKNALRFAASQTYTMPQFKETAPFLYSDVNFSSFGNPYLQPSTNYNIDLKYDWYLSRKEIISAGAIYKYIQDPISRVRVLSAANDLSYVNTEKAFVTGVEIEIKKNIFSLEAEDDVKKNDLNFGLNGSYLYTEQVQNDDPRDQLNVQFTHGKGKMQGAAPLLLNTDLSWYKANENRAFTSTVVFAYFYNRVYSVGTAGNENLVENTVPSLDFINKFELLQSKLAISLNFKNILNPKYRITQEATNNSSTQDYEISTYRKGMFVSLGLNWTL